VNGRPFGGLRPVQAAVGERENRMRTVTIIVGGQLLLGLFVLVGRRLGGDTTQSMVTAAKVFLPVWLVAALINMWIGVSRAGYSVAEELPIFLAIFTIPAIAAALIWWRLASGSPAA